MLEFKNHSGKFQLYIRMHALVLFSRFFLQLQECIIVTTRLEAQEG